MATDVTPSNPEPQPKSPKRPPRPAHFRVTINEVNRRTGDVIRWSFSDPGNTKSVDKKGNLNFGNTTEWPGVELAISLINRTRPKIKDLQFADDPVLITKGNQCPKNPNQVPGTIGREFKVRGIGKGRKLELDDFNTEPGDYCYTLRFKSLDSETGYFLLDPVISNGGGGGMEPPLGGGRGRQK